MTENVTDSRQEMSRGPASLAANAFSLTKQESIVSNIYFLVIHLCFFLWYLLEKMPVLFGYNLFSISVFLFNFYLIRKGKRMLVNICSYSEIFLFMTINVLGLGWEYGFELYCFGFLTAALLMDSLLIDGQKLHWGVRVFVMADIFWFVCLRCVTYFYRPLYVHGNGIVRRVMYLINALSTMLLIFDFVMMHMKKARGLEIRLHEAATRDALTGLYNRRYAETHVQALLAGEGAGADDPEKGEWLVAIMDIDHFKEINDGLGHAAGDAVLVGLGELLREWEREHNPFFCARWGGEEFLIACRQQSGQQIPEALRRQIERHVVAFDGRQIRLTVTIGVCGQTEAESFEDLLRIADHRLYRGKESGRNRVVA